jgi:ribosomal protein L32
MKRGKFFCENCGTEVRPNAKVCPHCGRFFRAVRCPVCSFTGESTLFLRGCPNCGYAGGQRPGASVDSGFEVYTPEEVEGVSAEKRGRRLPAGYARKTTPPPPWLYWLIFATLLVAFGVLVLIYLSI